MATVTLKVRRTDPDEFDDFGIFLDALDELAIYRLESSPIVLRRSVSCRQNREFPREMEANLGPERVVEREGEREHRHRPLTS